MWIPKGAVLIRRVALIRGPVLIRGNTVYFKQLFIPFTFNFNITNLLNSRRFGALEL